MPNTFAALALAAVISTSPSMVITCANTLSSPLSLLMSSQTKDKRRHFLPIDTKCPAIKDNGSLEVIKKNDMGDILVLQSTFKDGEVQTLVVEWGPSGKGFTRPVDMTRGHYASRAHRNFFVRAMKALEKLNATCGDEKARAAYFDSLRENRNGFEGIVSGPQTAYR